MVFSSRGLIWRHCRTSGNSAFQGIRQNWTAAPRRNGQWCHSADVLRYSLPRQGSMAEARSGFGKGPLPCQPVEKMVLWEFLGATGSASAVESRLFQHWQSQWHTFSTGSCGRGSDRFVTRRALQLAGATRKNSIGTVIATCVQKGVGGLLLLDGLLSNPLGPWPDGAFNMPSESFNIRWGDRDGKRPRHGGANAQMPFTQREKGPHPASRRLAALSQRERVNKTSPRREGRDWLKAYLVFKALPCLQGLPCLQAPSARDG